MRSEDTDEGFCSHQAAHDVQQGWMVTVETASMAAAAGLAVQGLLCRASAVLLQPPHPSWPTQVPFPGKEAGAFRARFI